MLLPKHSSTEQERSAALHEDRVEENLHVRTALKENGYPIHFI